MTRPPESRCPKGGEIAGRLRAARAYAGLKQPELATALRVSLATLSRMENGQTTVSDARRLEIADICGVPSAFMEVGFDPLTRAARPERQLEARIADLERQAAAHGWNV